MARYNRDLMRRWTLLCLMRGIENSDDMRALLARHLQLSEAEICHRSTNSLQSDFVNEHAWALSELNRGRRPEIEKISDRHYRITERGRELIRQQGLERHLAAIDRLIPTLGDSAPPSAESESRKQE